MYMLFCTQDHPLGHQEESAGEAALHKDSSAIVFRTFFLVFDTPQQDLMLAFLIPPEVSMGGIQTMVLSLHQE